MAELLKIQNLTLTRNHKTICHDFSLELKPGHFWGILGMNGRGKTTLLHTLAGLIPPLAGEITLGNRDISTLTRKQIAEKIALLLQNEGSLYPMTVYDVVESGGYARKKTKQDALMLENILNDLNLNIYRNHNLSELSGGEQRRVSIGRLLFQQPNLYLLDEPINHLDPTQKYSVLSYFKNLCKEQNNCVVMTGHHLELVQIFCDRVLLLCEDGTVLFGDTKEMLISENLELVYGPHPHPMRGKGFG